MTLRHNLYYFLLQSGFDTSDRLILAGLIFLIVLSFLVFARLLSELIITQLENKFQNGQFKIWLSITNNLNYPFIILTALLAASFTFYLPLRLSQIIDGIYLFILVFLFINFLREVISNSIHIFLLNKKDVSPEAIKTVINFTNVTTFIVLWILAILIFLQFSAVDTQALLSGLGVASVIVAFSFQSMLKDVFAFFSIYIDRSFAVGDYIVFDNIEGTIKEIRLRTTRITALGGNDAIIPNDKITSGIVENYNRLPRRRVSINFTVQNNLSATRSKEFIEQLFANLTSDTNLLDKIDFRTAVLDDISSLGIRYKVIYFFRSGDYLDHLEHKQRVIHLIMQTLTANKLKLVSAPELSLDSSPNLGE